MAKLTTDQYVAARSARHSHLVQTFTIMFAASIANMFLILSFGPSAGLAAKVALAVLVVATCVYSILAVKSVLDDLKALGQDARDDLAGSGFGAHLAQIPVGLFNSVSAALNLLIALTQLWTIF